MGERVEEVVRPRCEWKKSDPKPLIPETDPHCFLQCLSLLLLLAQEEKTKDVKESGKNC